MCSIRDLLETARQKLGYLRVVTPRRSADTDDDIKNSFATSRRYVVVDGRVVEVDASGTSFITDERNGAASRAPIKNWGPGNMDPDSVRRHEGLMKRFRFEDRAGAIPRGPFSQ